MSASINQFKPKGHVDKYLESVIDFPPRPSSKRGFKINQGISWPICHPVQQRLQRICPYINYVDKITQTCCSVQSPHIYTLWRPHPEWHVKHVDNSNEKQFP